MNRAIKFAFILYASFCIPPASYAAITLKKVLITSNTKSCEKTVVTNILPSTPEHSVSGISANVSMPRGRGNGKQAGTSMFLGFASMFPGLGFLFGTLALIKGIPNMRKNRKGHGMAIAGVIMATFFILLWAYVFAFM